MSKSFNGFIKSIATAAMLLLSVTCTSSFAQEYGLRGGYDTDFEQVLIGGQAELSKVAEIARFAPSLDLGFGNDVTTFAVNGDFRFFITPPKATTTLYGGLGPTLLLANPKGGDTDSEFGLTFHGGVKFGAGKSQIYNVEVRFGLDKMPDLRLFFGMFF